jgi:hypothetical protein
MLQEHRENLERLCLQPDLQPGFADLSRSKVHFKSSESNTAWNGGILHGKAPWELWDVLYHLRNGKQGAGGSGEFHRSLYISAR